MGVSSTVAGETILRVEKVTVSFEGFLALNGLTFTMEPGELRVVIGPNGAGKTTLLDVITGKVRPRSGRVLFTGRNLPTRDITRLPEQQIAQLGIGRKFQTPNVFKSLSVLDNLKLALKSPRGVWATLARPFSSDGLARLQEIAETVGLVGRLAQPAGVLAHGEKQWLELGMLLAQDPELLLIDEPVAGMTPRESERTGELLLAMARKHALLIIEHDMTFVRQIARRVTVLDEGQTLCEGTVDEVQKDARVIEVYLGQDKREERVPRPAWNGVAGPGAPSPVSGTEQLVQRRA
jgi:urea transport system ATP-binding protein